MPWLLAASVTIATVSSVSVSVYCAVYIPYSGYISRVYIFADGSLQRISRIYFRGLSSSLLAHAHINMQLYLHTVSLKSRLSLYKIIESVRHYVLHL